MRFSAEPRTTLMTDTKDNPRTSTHRATETTPLLINSTPHEDPPYSRTLYHIRETPFQYLSGEQVTSSRFLVDADGECYCKGHQKQTSTLTFQVVEGGVEAETSHAGECRNSLPLNDSDIQRKPPNNPPAVHTPPQLSWFNWNLPQKVCLRLENSGSVARDHLASERTFLAYMRTSLAIASAGVALVQLFSVASASASPHILDSNHRLHTYVRPLGASTVIIGLLVLIIGVVRYFAVQSALTKGYFPAARLAIGFITVALTALVTLTFAVLLAGKLEPKEKRE